MAEQFTEAKEGLEYAVSLSPSGLLIDIQTFHHGEPFESISLGRFAWPKIVEAVARVMTRSRVDAEVGIALHQALGELDNDD